MDFGHAIEIELGFGFGGSTSRLGDRFCVFSVFHLCRRTCDALQVGRPLMHHPNVPLKNAPSKRTLVTSFQRFLAEPPQQAAAAPTTHTRSDEE